MMITPIVFGAFMTGVLTGSTLIYLLIKSYRAALITGICALVNLGLLLFVVLR